MCIRDSHNKATIFSRKKDSAYSTSDNVQHKAEQKIKRSINPSTVVLKTSKNHLVSILFKTKDASTF